VAPRAPSDAVVALRSLERRFGAVFAGRGDDESPDDLAHRIGSQGRSALDHVVAAARTIALLGRALDQILVSESAVLHPGVADPSERDWPDGAAGTVEERLEDLAREARSLADRAARAHGADWDRRGQVAGQDASISAAAILWDAVDTALGHLKSAQEILAEVRGRG
jgi:hypothetical protein